MSLFGIAGYTSHYRELSSIWITRVRILGTSDVRAKVLMRSSTVLLMEGFRTALLLAKLFYLMVMPTLNFESTILNDVLLATTTDVLSVGTQHIIYFKLILRYL